MLKHNNHILFISNKKIPAKGFTLIETLLGLLIFSLIIVCVYGTLKTGIDLSRRFEDQKDISRQAQLAMDLFSHDIEASTVYDFSNSYAGHLSFEGLDEKLTLISRSEDTLKVISYYLSPPQKIEIKQTVIGKHYQRNTTVTQSKQESAITLCLIREEMDFIDYISGGFQMNGQKEILLEGIPEKGVRFSYTSQTNDEGTIVWKQDWKDSERPLAVKMDVKIVRNEDQETQTFDFEKIVLVPSAIKIKRIK
ncbi:MAG: type II secretion system protein [Candidatus Omnitrophica bacterium]|nr:type II secretion system protein [Candidatus Omnitrophota bacterium]